MERHRRENGATWRIRWDWGRTSRGMALPGLVLAWWLTVGGIMVWMLPSTAHTTPGSLPLTRGQAAQIYQPTIRGWPIPTERAAFDLFQRGARESDEDAIDRAFVEYEWLPVWHGQWVHILNVDGEAVQVELREGPHAGRTGWLRHRNVTI